MSLLSASISTNVFPRQGIIKALLILSILWKIKFYKGESNCKVTVIAAGGLGCSASPLVGRFLHYGGTGGCGKHFTKN